MFHLFILYVGYLSNSFLFGSLIEHQNPVIPMLPNNSKWKIELANHTHRDKIMEIRHRILNTPVVEEKKTSETKNKRSKVRILFLVLLILLSIVKHIVLDLGRKKECSIIHKKR